MEKIVRTNICMCVQKWKCIHMHTFHQLSQTLKVRLYSQGGILLTWKKWINIQYQGIIYDPLTTPSTCLQFLNLFHKQFSKIYLLSYKPTVTRSSYIYDSKGKRLINWFLPEKGNNIAQLEFLPLFPANWNSCPNQAVSKHIWNGQKGEEIKYHRICFRHVMRPTKVSRS